ncbi:uncharacterized protein LOC120359338 [Solenopsis invicta]|uniref:uncharacterized protein LOC120359338 n=1 Tax=Solenopsis invicta TaxID=13686 RepID=UPI00193E38EA|nr:uncharacterized protein LOC120359338 [Solenopsis invicta]
MENLGQIESIRDKIKSASRPAIQDESNEYRAKFEYSNNFNVGDLTSMCNVLGLCYTGTREELRVRVIRALMDVNSLVPKESQDEDGEEDDDADEDVSQHSDNSQGASHDNSDDQTDSDHSENRRREKRKRSKINFAVNFKDVEDSVRTFDGSDDYPVERWIADFEDTAMLFEWNSMQKLVFARKLLKGAAKTFLQSEGVVKNWKKLKTILEDEFSSKISSAELHRMLATRKMKKEENVQEYYLSMKELGSRGNIDKESVIQYIIDGITDEETNKVLLYGAKDFTDFKERLRTYEKMKLAQDRKTTKSKESAKNKEDSSKQVKKGAKESSTKTLICYNCGANGHKANTCKFKDQGKKCFRCNKFGHESSNCTVDNSKSKTSVETKTAVNLNIESNNSIERMCKEITINDVKINALIDTGSQLCLLREDIYSRLNSKDLLKSYIMITGIAQGKAKTLEEANTNIDLIIDKDVKETIDNLITSYEPKRCKSTNIELSIVLKDESPIYQRPYRTSIQEKEIIEKVVDEWVKEEIVEPCSSEFASPVLIVKKKDGSPRVCVDYRRINKVIVKDRFPLPLIEDQIDQLVEASIFSTIDLTNGFFHVSVAKENDLIIVSSDIKQGIEQLKLVLHIASEYGLEINKKKCQFMKTRITFLGYIVEAGRVYPSPEKITAVLHFPEPRNVKDVQIFLGLTGYFRKFIKSYSIIAKPLSDLLQKDDKPFNFDVAEKQAFDQLKELLGKSPVLEIFNPKLKTELHTDACRDGFGAILLQRNPNDNKLHPVYYFSRKTSVAEHCAALRQTMDKIKLCPKIARWATALEEYDKVIEHRSGSQIRHVDALSRYPVMNIVENSISVKIKEAQRNDSELKAIIEVLKHKAYDDYLLRNDVLYKYKDGQELLVPPKSMYYEVIQMAHDKANKKEGKQEGFLNPLEKVDLPLYIYHVDHLGPLESTHKNYNHIFAVIDSFTKRKKAVEYKLGNLVAIKRVQLGLGRKLRAKYLGPYKICKIKPNKTYDVKRIDTGEGPALTSTCAEYLKPWSNINNIIEGDD